METCGICSEEMDADVDGRVRKFNVNGLFDVCPDCWGGIFRFVGLMDMSCSINFPPCRLVVVDGRPVMMEHVGGTAVVDISMGATRGWADD